MKAKFMTPRVGVGVLVCKDDSILLGQRKTFDGKEFWSVPGGHLDWMETFESCGKKEVRRETGLEVEEIEFLTATNNLSQGEKRSTHSVSIFMIAQYISGEPTITDPEKCLAWQWFKRSDLPNNMSVWMKQMVAKTEKPRFLK